MAIAHHKTAKNRELVWHNRLWLPAIYKEQADRIVIPKASQLGISEYLFVKKMSSAHKGLNGMYILPTEGIRNRVVSARVDPIINYVPFYRNNIAKERRGVDSTSIKSLFGSKWNYVGSNSKATFYEFVADILIYDEFDRCDQANLLIAKERTGASDRIRWVKVGNPERSASGIEAEYDLSNKQVWKLKCEHCNKWQTLDWFINFVDRKDNGSYFLKDRFSQTSEAGITSPSNAFVPESDIDAQALCRFCNKQMNRLAQGIWVAEKPSVTIAGYRCDKLFGSPGNDASSNPRPIIKEMFSDFVSAQNNETALEIFYNQQLGLPYEAEGNHISIEMIQACIDSEYALPLRATDTVAGMDIGAVHHLHISSVVKDLQGRRVRRKVFMGNVKSWEEADRICKLFGVKRGVLDAQGEIHAQRNWVREHSGWLMCYYSIGRDSVKAGVTVSRKDKTIRVNRTESLDASYACWADKTIILPKNALTIDGGDFIRQMTAGVRRFDEKRGYYIWDEGSKPDHHQHADNYERIALELYKSASDLVMVVKHQE